MDFPVDTTDILELFLKDVANINPIKGRAEYLPLTRRIERGRLLMSLAGKSFQLTFPRVQGTLRKALGKFNEQCQASGRPVLIPEELVKQIEEYLDNPQILTPPALAQRIGQPLNGDREAHKQFERLGWRCFYLLALFPSKVRANALSCQPIEAILKHFRLIALERKQSRSRLIEGTLRYILRIALSYMGRGLPYLDLVQEGYFGLQRAADRFVEHEGAHFQQYAAQWIQQKMIRAIGDQSRLVRLPVHVSEKLTQLKRLELEYENDLVFDPHARDRDIIERLGLSNEREIESKPHKAALKLKRLREADTRHYPMNMNDIADLIVDEESIEEAVELKLLNHTFQEWLQRFPTREREIVRLRTGLADGEVKTLEEIGQMYGVTRERIRQIEAKFYRRMEQHQSKYAFNGASPETDHRIGNAYNDQRQPLRDLLSTVDISEVFQQDKTYQERRFIEQRIEKRILHGKRRMTGKRGQSSRSALFAQVLSESGQPLHFNEIHQRTLASLPPEQHFTKEVAYAALFYSDRFRLLGGGVFSLASWENTTRQTTNGHVFNHCPPPLMPANAHPRTFLESILIARQLIQTRPKITVIQFYEEMLSKAGRDRSNPQDAFDAWYAAGLHDHIEVSRQALEIMRLAIPPEWKLSEVRLNCLNHLCRRIVKMPELLAALDRLANVNIPTLQKLLFGSESAGFDVPLRLTMLAAFEAVRADGSNWRITDLGRTVLKTNPPHELPDFSVIETPEPDERETDDWDDHLEIFTL
jgi:RNA polymerase primary sigma factor